MSDFLHLFGLMVAVHFLLDYPLQGDFLSKAKNAFAPIPGVPWYQAMTAHCFIQAAGVWIITGNAFLGFAEFLAHFATDYAKCAGKVSFNGDQAIHIASKALFAFAAIVLVST